MRKMHSDHDIQKKRFQSISPAQKLQLSLDLNFSARKVKAAFLKSQHPEWTDRQIADKVREIFLYART